MTSPDVFEQLGHSQELREDLLEQLAHCEALKQQLQIQREMLRTHLTLIAGQQERICSRWNEIERKQGKRHASPAGTSGDDACGTDRFPVRWIGSLAVMTLPEEIDVTIRSPMDEHLGALLDLKPTTLVADMSRTRFCDCSGVRALLQARRRARVLQVPFLIEGVREPVMRILEMLGADRALQTHPWLDAAPAENADPG